MWTDNQAPHTLGILCDPDNPLFNDFPTEFYSNWQWWDIVKDAKAMNLQDFPPELIPDIQLIDTWFEARRLGLLFQGKVGEGKIVVTSSDLGDNLEHRPAAKQLYISVLNYMQSDLFNPAVNVELESISKLWRE